MAIKIRCKRCSRRISIDEAFAGGVCRCPYCKTINNVPDEFGLRSAAPRPDAPPTGVTSGPRVAMRAGAASGVEDIPVADRMVFQGVATLILMVMLIAMLVAGVALVVSSINKDKVVPTGNGPTNGDNGLVPPDERVQTNPFVTGPARTVAGGIAFKTPVVYCIDASGSMRGVYYYAVRMTAASIDSLSVDDVSFLIIAEEEGTRTMASNAIGGIDGEAVDRFAGDITPGGEGDTIGALEEAMAGQPATVVLFASKIIDAPSLLALAEQWEVVIVTVSLGGNEVINESLATLAEQTGGKGLSFGRSQLERWYKEAD